MHFKLNVYGVCLIGAAAILSSSCSSSNSGQLRPSQLDGEIEWLTRSVLSSETARRSSGLHAFLSGQIHYDSQNYEDATKNFRAAGELLGVSEPYLNARLAELSLREGNLESALLESERALNADPDNYDLMLLRAGVLDALKRNSEAERIYVQLIEKDPSRLEPSILLASHYLKHDAPQQAITILMPLEQKFADQALVPYYIGKAHEQLGDLVQAKRYLSAALALDPGNGPLAVELLRVLVKLRDLEAIKTLCGKILERDPSSTLARKILGNILLGEERFDEALEHLQELEGAEKDAGDTRFKIALIQLRRRNYAEAIRELNLVLADNPKHAEARYQLASALASQGQISKAVEELLKIDRSDDLFARAKTYAAFLMRQDGNAAGAEKALREALEVNSEDSQVLSFLVLVLRDLDKLEQALETLRRLMELEPENERVLLNAGLVLHDLGRADEAAAMMERVIALNPRSGDALNYVAYSLAEAGRDLERAMNLIKTALELRPDDGYYLDTYGWVLYKMGQLAEAEVQLARAVAIVPDDAEILEHYGDVLNALGNKEGAKEAYEKAIASLAETSRTFDSAKRRLKDKLGALKSLKR